MPHVRVRENEPFDIALRRFKRSCEKAGVLSEVITTGAITQLITPGTICFNSSPTATTYAKVVNKSGSTANVTVTLTYVQIEN